MLKLLTRALMLVTLSSPAFASSEGTPLSSAEFLDRVGHRAERLQDGETLRVSVRLQSAREYRDVFGINATPMQRRDASAFRPEAHDPKSLALGSFMKAVHVGEKTLTPKERIAMQTILPLDVEILAAKTATISTDVIKTRAFGITAGRLVFDGGSITMKGAMLSITADTVRVIGGGQPNYLVGILGVQGAAGAVGAPGQPFDAPAAAGLPSRPDQFTGCDHRAHGGTGVNGQTGQPGNSGEMGKAGLASAHAYIDFSDVDTQYPTPFSIFTQSGAGGIGGAGGVGGTGQQGGHGGHGCVWHTECTDGGKGGAGGMGGTGGNGGPGGPPTAGQSIYIKFPRHLVESHLSRKSKTASGGAGGAAGAAGQGGLGGLKGQHTHQCHDGNDGPNGPVGTVGKPGPANMQIAAPGDFHTNDEAK